jgi:hypothetical protein
MNIRACTRCFSRNARKATTKLWVGINGKTTKLSIYSLG